MREYLPRALDRVQPSNKPRQALLDYALWHGQHAWAEQLAIQAQFAPARRLAPGGSFAWPASDLALDFARVQERAWREVALLRQRHLQPYAARNFKELRTCDQYGVDHRTPTGSSPLMMAARAGNLALIDALLMRGANPLLEDEFGHTPWLFALGRAMEDNEFARQSITPLFERIAPPVLDVQTDGRLVRLERHQGEYWILSLMLAGLKTLRTQCVPRPSELYKYGKGFFADELNVTLTCLPEHLWKTKRHKRTYVNGVLARAEIHSSYLPARRLWARTANGHYLPSPKLQLRAHTSGDTPAWRPVYDVLNLAWVDAGTADLGGWDVPLKDYVDAISSPTQHQLISELG